jgi:hypothetical protein
MIATRTLPFLFVIAAGVLLNAQEVRYIDLTVVQQRTELRNPPAPPPQCDANGCSLSGGVGGASVADGAPDLRDPRALGIYVLRVTPTDIDPNAPFEAEFRVLNTGRVPIDLPVSPHLADLQPDDASLSFTWFSLALVARVTPAPYTEVRSFGLAQLYGSPDHEGTMIRLYPGQWIRVKANLKLNNWQSKPSEARVYGEFWLRKNTFHPHPGGSFTEIQNLYPNVTQMSPESWLPVFVHAAADSANSGNKR